MAQFVPERILSCFRSVATEDEFESVFRDAEVARNLQSWLGLDRSAVHWFNLYMRHRFESFVEPTIRKWVECEFSGDTCGRKTGVCLRWIRLLRWDQLYRHSCSAALESIIQLKVQELAESPFDEKVAQELQRWLSATLLPFARTLFSESAESHCQSLMTIARELFVETRGSKLFEIIADFPDSIVAITELRDHLFSSQGYILHDLQPAASTGVVEAVAQSQPSQLLGRLGKSLRKAIESRLLHLGAATSQILDFYVSMIGALRILDSSDALLNYALVPVRVYLKQRKDAVRCIISSLTESKESDLHSALRNGMSLAYGIDEDDEEAGPGVCWKPKQRNADLRDVGQTRGLDVLASLVSIYGSTDLFVAEFRQLLAEKLLANLQYTTDEELTNIELLKIRFGEDCLHACEVMLKDVQDSKRTNTAIHAALGKEGKVDAVDMVLVSEHYWPSLSREGPALHQQAQALLDDYLRTYSVLKKPRKLAVLPSLGTVELDLVFADGCKRSFSVTPLQASLICHLQTQSHRALSDLAVDCEVDESDVAMAMRFWVNRGVVREAMDMGDDGYGGLEEQRFYEVIEEQSASRDAEVSGETGSRLDGAADSDWTDRLEAQQQARSEATKAVVAEYVRGLLSSHGSMGVDRLCSLLQIILTASSASNPTDYSFATNMASLRQFLNDLVNKGVLEVVDGLFSLAKSGV